MHLQVIENSFKDAELQRPFYGRSLQAQSPRMGQAVIRIEMDGKEYAARMDFSAEAAVHVPYEAFIRPLRQQIMAAIEKRLFGDFNQRVNN